MATDDEDLRFVTEIHQAHCPCQDCEEPYRRSIPADVIDSSLLARLAVAPLDRFDYTVRCRPGVTLTVSGTWGDGAARDVTLTYAVDRHSSQSVRCSIGDVRATDDSVSINRRGAAIGYGWNRTFRAGRYVAAQRQVVSDERSLQLPLTTFVEQVTDVADDMRDVVVSIDSETGSDYGSGGELCDSPRFSISVCGWVRDEQP